MGELGGSPCPPEVRGSPGLEWLSFSAAQGRGEDGSRVLTGALYRAGPWVNCVGHSRLQVGEEMFKVTSAHSLLELQAHKTTGPEARGEPRESGSLNSLGSRLRKTSRHQSGLSGLDLGTPGPARNPTPTSHWLEVQHSQ